MNFLSRFLVRWAALITVVSIVLSVVGGYYTVVLFKNLRTDIEELLPTQARSVIDLNEVVRRLKSTENLAILVFSEHPDKSRAFVDELASRLSQAPKDILAGVEYRIDREIEFFSKRKALYLELEDLKQISSYIRERIQFERELHNPLNIFRTTELPEPVLDFLGMERKYLGKASYFTRFPGGYYASQDEKVRAVIANVAGGTSGISSAIRLRQYVDQVVAEVGPKNYADDLEIRFSGGAQNLIEEHEALIEDLVLSSVIVFVLCAVAMLFYYKTLRGTFCLVTSLLMGTVWAFGMSYPLVGYLNANSAFMAAIIIGNGINFPIIFLARYMEERKAHRGHIRSLHSAIVNTVGATSVAALAAALSYGSLMLTSFRGFIQFGIIGFIGMVLCWVAAYTVMPAMLTLTDRIRPLNKRIWKESRHYLSGAVIHLVRRFHRPVWWASIAACVISVVAVISHPGDILEADLSRLRSKSSMEHGSGYYNRYLDQIFGRDLSPVVIMPHSREQAYAIARKLKDKMKADGENALISGVRAFNDFVPEKQEEKIALARGIRNMLYPELILRLSREERQKVEDFLTPESMKVVTDDDIPPLIRSKFTEKDGTMGNLVLVEPQLGSNRWPAETLIRFIREIREITDSVDKGAPVAGQLPVSSDLFESVLHDGPRATLFALLAVILLCTALFRNIRSIALVLTGLIFGVAWMVGWIYAFDIKVNFLNFIAFPITFGIGVDYGVNIFQRYRLEGPGKILSVLHQTGGAVLLASYTTIVGYGSLLIASNRAFVSLGTFAVLGEITCLIAALVSLPAYLTIRDRRRIRGEERAAALAASAATENGHTVAQLRARDGSGDEQVKA